MAVGLAVVRATASSPAASAAGLDGRRRYSEYHECDDQPHGPPEESHADQPLGNDTLEYPNTRSKAASSDSAS
jgi:hypothetical protein